MTFGIFHFFDGQVSISYVGFENQNLSKIVRFIYDEDAVSSILD